jgi:hypothetical protein
MLAANHIEDLDWATFAFLCWTCSEHGPSSDSVQQRSRGEHASWRPTPLASVQTYDLADAAVEDPYTISGSQILCYNVNVNIIYYKISRQIPPSCSNCNAKNSSCKGCSDMSSSPYVLCISNFGRTARSSLLARMVVENLQPVSTKVQLLLPKAQHPQIFDFWVIFSTNQIFYSDIIYVYIYILYVYR